MLRRIVPFIITLLFMASQAFATPSEDVKKTVDEVVRIVSDKNMKRNEGKRRQTLKRTIGVIFDYSEMAKRSLGKHWNDRSDAEKKQFIDLFATLLENSYAGKIESYNNEKIVYLKENVNGNFAEVKSKVITAKRLRTILEELIAQGAHNINLVNPTHFTPWILEALTPPLPVPVVWNSGGYDRVETLRTLEGKVQIFLPDLKYAMEEPARRYSGAADYFPVARAAIEEMFHQTGPYKMENGLMTRGVIIRHLVLPGQLENTRRCIDYVASAFRPGDVLFSLMSQYTPQPGVPREISRHVTKSEYRAATEYMENCGITDGFLQERTSAREEYTPPFDLTGV